MLNRFYFSRHLLRIIPHRRSNTKSMVTMVTGMAKRRFARYHAYHRNEVSGREGRLSEVRTNERTNEPWQYLKIQQLGTFQTDKYRRNLYDIIMTKYSDWTHVTTVSQGDPSISKEFSFFFSCKLVGS